MGLLLTLLALIVLAIALGYIGMRPMVTKTNEIFNFIMIEKNAGTSQEEQVELLMKRYKFYEIDAQIIAAGLPALDEDGHLSVDEYKASIADALTRVRK